MTTKFYDALQLDPSILKRRIAACETKKEKNFYRAAMAVRSALIVAFAILFISLLSGLFGADNTPMAVALFCMLLGIRFVNFEYCAGDSLAGLAAALAILTLAPCAAAQAGPALVAPLHLAAFFALLFLTSQRPEMGNGGIYSFAYIYLTGNPVAGEALARRGRWRCVWRTRCWARPSVFVSPRCSTVCRAAFCPRRTRRSEPKHKTKTGAPLLAVRRFFGLFSEPCSRTLDYRGFLMAA